METKHYILAGVAVLILGLVGYKMLSKKKYAPIELGDETYSHVETNEVNKVVQHYFTPGGVDKTETDTFLQIVKYDHSDLTERQVSVTQTQIIKSFGLQPLEGYEDRFFGMFRRSLPVYGYMGTDAFVLHFGPQADPADKDDLLAGADEFIDELAEIPTDL